MPYNPGLRLERYQSSANLLKDLALLCQAKSGGRLDPYSQSSYERTRPYTDAAWQRSLDLNAAMEAVDHNEKNKPLKEAKI